MTATDPFEPPERDNSPPPAKMWPIVRCREFYCRAYQDTTGMWLDLHGNSLPKVSEIVDEV